MLLVLIFAFVGGLLTILAPCTLPIVPLVLGAGSSGGARRAVGIALGFGASFVALSVVLASLLARSGLSTGQVRAGSAILLCVMGACLAVPWLGDRLAATLTPLGRLGPAAARRSGGLVGSATIGATIGVIWAPCVGPIMAGVLVAAADRGPSVDGLAIAVAYAAGAALPLLIVAGLGRRAIVAAGSPHRRVRLQQAFGALMLAASLAVVTGYDLPIETAVASVLPDGSTGGPSVAGLPAAPARGSAARLVGGASALPPPLASHLPADVALKDLGAAPELRGITAWINSPPLTMASLRGNVVLVHFWTFACINCLHVQPYVKAWAARYAAAGLVVIGVHTPELSFERDLANLRQAVASDGVTFPVAFDPSYATWNAYHNRYWPAFYFVDRNGQIRHTYSGEGDYAGSEQVIRELLAEPG
jgi:cytochrome c biogenesis protein CcdA/thiol-disulfide isomerase/thioredoxin